MSFISSIEGLDGADDVCYCADDELVIATFLNANKIHMNLLYRKMCHLFLEYYVSSSFLAVTFAIRFFCKLFVMHNLRELDER